MNFWRHIVSYFNRETPKGERSGGYRTGAIPLFGYEQGNAMGVATVFRCVKLLSESVANLPLQYLRRKDGIFTEVDNSRLDYLLNVQPDCSVNAFDFWRQVVQEVLLDGNAYIVPVYDPVVMDLCRLVLCTRDTVTHDTVNDCYHVRDLSHGISGRFPEAAMIHIKGLTLRDSKRGVSVLTYARRTMNIADAGDRETHNRFANGGNVRGIISNDRSVPGFGEYADEQLAKTAADIDGLFQGGERIVSLPGQVDFKQISLSSTDMQFLESRKFTVIEICRFFSVPPTFVYADTSANYKTVEQADIDFLSHTLNPLLRNIETELRRKLIPQSLSHRYKFKFDRRELFACDLNGMMNYGTKLLQVGTTVNEVRRMNNLPPVGGGDTVMVSANLRPVTDLAVSPAPTDSHNSQNSHDSQE